MKCPNAACAAWTTPQDAVVDHESEPGRRHVFRCPWCGYRWGRALEQDVDLDGPDENSLTRKELRHEA